MNNVQKKEKKGKANQMYFHVYVNVSKGIGNEKIENCKK